MFEIRRYTDADKVAWNNFVNISRQGTFLFNREYMDYHRDRFHDFSLIVYRDSAIFALLPANVDGNTLWTHQGLTYGGLLTDNHATTVDVINIFLNINDFLRLYGIKKVIYKPMPWIYQRQPSEEDLYVLTNICHADIIARYISSTIDFRHPVKWRYGRKYDANKAMKADVSIIQSNDALSQFWEILNANLMQNHKVKPVHTYNEMERLQSLFPDNIKLYVAVHNGNLVAGSLLFLTPQVVHTQYISANEEGKQLHALDLLFRKVFEDVKGYSFFDFGNSNEEHGRVLNRGLIFQKEGFGGRGVCYDWYEYSL